MTQRKAYELAKTFTGLQEIEGAEDEPKIVAMFADVGHAWVKDDETAWCAAFVGAMLERVGLPSTRALNARSYLKWGKPVKLSQAHLGDLVVFSRGDPNGWQGHVAFYVSQNTTTITVLGGNQGDKVSVSKYAKSRLLGVRRDATASYLGGNEKPTFDLWAWIKSLFGVK